MYKPTSIYNSSSLRSSAVVIFDNLNTAVGGISMVASLGSVGGGGLLLVVLLDMGILLLLLTLVSCNNKAAACKGTRVTCNLFSPISKPSKPATTPSAAALLTYSNTAMYHL